MASPPNATIYTTRAWVIGVPTQVQGIVVPPLPYCCTWCYWSRPLSGDALLSLPCPSLLPFSLFLDDFTLLSESLQWLSRTQRTSPSILGDTQGPGWSGPCPLPSLFFHHPRSLDVIMVSAASDLASVHLLIASDYHWYHSLLQPTHLYFSYSHSTSTIFPISTYPLWSSFFSLTQPSFELTWISFFF